MISASFLFQIKYNNSTLTEIDPILPFSEITKIDTTLGKIRAKVTIEDLQRDIATVQLIPETTENIKHLFKIAKDLYIYGYFKYAFSKVSNHYASLALEVAIKTRYVKSLGEEVVITYEERERVLNNPTWWDIDESFSCEFREEKKGMYVKRRRRRDMKKFKVNGQKFQATMWQLLNWVVENEIINEQQRKELEGLIHLRNIYSHPEYQRIKVPNSRTLDRVADYINILMKSLHPIKIE